MSKIIPTFAPQSGHVNDFYVTQHILTQFIHLINYEGSCKSSVSLLTQLDEAEAPKLKTLF